MSVIAKFNVQAVRDFGSGALIELSNICENDLMAAYNPDHEDKLFTKYSPWGEARLHVRQGVVLPLVQDQFYAVITSLEELGIPPKTDYNDKTPILAQTHALYRTKLSIQGITDRGEGQAKQIEFLGGINDESGVTAFNWRMAVDNPGATGQLKAGSSNYFVGFYPRSKFSYLEAVNAALTPPTMDDSAAAEELTDA
jgi:hypothetical protein